MRKSALLLVLLLYACGPRNTAPPRNAAPPSVSFTDVTREAGIDFVHHNGATGKMFLPETMGSGCAFLDYDSDGRLDILLVNGASWLSADRRHTMRLYRNAGSGRFVDVTTAAGLNFPLYGMGVTAGDFDNDGFDDLFITAVGRSRLLHNLRGRRFVDITATAGVEDRGWSTSATWFDYDRDGQLDLFVCHYVRWTPESNRYFSVDGVRQSYSTPEQYLGESCRLYHNQGGRRFRDVTRESGIQTPRSKALGVVALDFDQDGWQDLAVANDTEPNFLFHNQTDGTFKEVALEMGIAVSDEGRAKAGMGIDAGDEMNDGAESLAITNFSGEQLSLYRRGPSGSFFEVAAQSGIGSASQLYLGFGVCFLDYDLDGRLDLFISNGHIQGDVGLRQSGVLYREPALLLWNQGEGTYSDASATAGPALQSPMIGRGAAWGDYDNDGDPDLLISTNHGDPASDRTDLDGRARLLRNDGGSSNSWLRVVLEGTRDNRDAFGARARIRTSSGDQTRVMRAASSYLSQSDPRLLFGLRKGERVEALEIQWPSGQLQIVNDVPIDRTITVKQPDSPL